MEGRPHRDVRRESRRENEELGRDRERQEVVPPVWTEIEGFLRKIKVEKTAGLSTTRTDRPGLSHLHILYLQYTEPTVGGTI